MSYSVVDLNDLPGEGPGGMVRKLRRALGARAFGFNHFTIPAGVEGREHDHAEAGHEEVYVVLRRSGRMVIDGEEVELEARDLPPRRSGVAAHAGCRPGGARVRHLRRALERRYEPPDWG